MLFFFALALSLLRPSSRLLCPTHVVNVVAVQNDAIAHAAHSVVHGGGAWGQSVAERRDRLPMCSRLLEAYFAPFSFRQFGERGKILDWFGRHVPTKAAAVKPVARLY